MSIWLVEDDPLQAKSILRVLEENFPGEDLRHIKTERQFEEALASVQQPRPSVIVMDVMLPWTEVSITPSGEVVAEKPPEGYNNHGGIYRAGMRCVKRLQENEKMRPVPVVLLTVLTEGDLASDLIGLPDNVSYLSKRDEPERLISLVGELMRKGR